MDAAVDLVMIDTDLPSQKPENAQRQDLALRKQSTRIPQGDQNTGEPQSVRGSFCRMMRSDLSSV